MKIRTKKVEFSYTEKIKAPKHRRPQKPWWILGALIRLISLPDLWATHFRFTSEGIKELKKEPCLILMNHSSFIDLEIAYRIFFPKRFSIVCTSDAFVGKSFIMRKLGCIPTNKFVTDISLIGDILHAIKKEKVSVLMYPEASYSFDGCATPLPRRLGVLIKKLDVPVITVKTEGAFLRDPLYNGLQKRKVKVTAHAKCLFNRDDIARLSADELSNILDKEFTFDNFARQLETKTEINEPFRADYLERILYKCAACGCETEMEGRGTKITCNACGKTYEMDKYGRLTALSGNTEFSHIPDWYNWERECIKKEIEDGSYSIETDVEIGILADYKAIYKVGQGHLSHNCGGFVLTGCDGMLSYSQDTKACYSLYADYYWYEIGDVICIGDKKRLYYCFPTDKTNVAKARLAAEELYKSNNTCKNRQKMVN